MRYLPPDISYGIECAAEHFDITGDVPAFFYNFNDQNITDAVDALDNREISWYACHQRYAELYHSVFEEWFANRATAAQQAWCVRGAASDFKQKVGETWDNLYAQYVSCSINSTHAIQDENNMRQFIGMSSRYHHVKRNIDAMVTRINAITASTISANMVNMAFSDPAALFILTEIPQRRLDCLEGVMTAEVDRDGRLDFAGRKQPKQIKAHIRRKTKEKQKVLKKSSAFLSRLIGQRDTVAFIRGDAIDVHGDRFSFQMKKANLQTTGHGGFNISVIDRPTGNRLVDLCWYQEATPALDQLSALVMMVRVGDEEEIIRVGNHLRVTQEARVHEFFPEHHVSENAINIDAIMTQVEWVNNTMAWVTNVAQVNEDVLLHHTPGTTSYIQNNATTYTAFINIVNMSVHSINTLSPEIRQHFVFPHAHEIRQINDNQVGTWIRQSEREPNPDFVTPQLMGQQLQNVLEQPGAMDRVVQQIEDELYVDAA